MRSYAFGPFRLDPAERLLLREGEAVPLTPKAFDLLVYLVERHGRLVTKQELLSAVWPDTAVEGANLAYTVSAIRKALGDGQDGEQFIQTVPTRGYRFIAPVTHEEGQPASPTPEGAARSRRDLLRRGATIALVAAVVAMLPVLVRHLRETPDAREAARFLIAVPDTAIGAFSVVAAISPDGRHMAFLVWSGGADQGHIWLRRMDAAQASPIAGTDDVTSLFWAPDSRQLAFTTTSALKKLIVANGAVETLCAACNPGRGGTWSRNGLILVPSPDGGLLGVRSAGGKPEAVTALDRSNGEVVHIAPSFLPDGDRFLYVIRNADAGRSGLFAGTIGSAERRLLLPGEHPAIYAAPGYLLFTRAGSIVAQPFDVRSLELRGDATPLVGPSEYSPTPVQGGDNVVVNWFGGWPSVSASETGILAYAIAEHPPSQFHWLRRSGEPLTLVGEPGPYQTFDLSADGSRLAFSRVAADHANVWVHDLARGVTSRLTFGASSSYYDPRWGPGGQWVAATRSAPPPLAIVTILPDGRESVVSAARTSLLDDVSRDGRYLLCRPRGAGHLVAIAIIDGKEPVLVRKPPAGFIDQARFSPDGRWIAYNANESGQTEVYLTAFPPTGERWLVSHGGGVQPVWRQDGRELYYLGLDGVLRAVELRTGDRPQLSVPKRLFDTGLVAPSAGVEQYAVSADGQRVLILKPVGDTVRNSIGVIVDWPALLQSPGSPRQRPPDTR